MVRLIKNANKFYTNISNELVQDENLSWKARGIFVYLWSQANEWQFYVSEIARHSPDGERALRSGLKELEDRGYLKRVNRKNPDGSFNGMDWILSDTPEIHRHAQNAVDGKTAENPPKVVQNASDAKRVRHEMCSTQKGTLININNNNYQYKKISNTIHQPVEDEDEVPYKEVIDYLNLKTGRTNDPIHQFKSTSQHNRDLIKERWDEGYRLEHFKAVIDTKVSQWLGTEREKFLKPDTIFSDKHFDDYLNQRPDDKFDLKASKKRKEIATDWSKVQAVDDPSIDLSQLEKDLEDEESKWQEG